jgi:signal transduction histidine kinase
VFRQFASVQERAIDARGATERMRGLFLASMSHDLKGPLNAILGFAELASRSELEPAQRESLTIIEQRGKELLFLVQTILDSARIEARQLHLERGWTKVGDVVMSAVLDAKELAAGAKVEVAAEIQPGVPKVYADAVRLVMALVAIVTSTMHLVPEGRIVLRATIPSEGERLCVDVEAHGRSGIAQQREKIFEAFRDPARARRHGSLGLGLWLARALVELHGGTIDVETSEDGGLVFRVWLPVDPPGAKTDQYQAQPA